MANEIYVNLHVKDLEKSKSFYQKIGFKLNEVFSDDTAACIVVSDTIYIMLLTHDKFKQFTSKKITDAHNSTEVLNALSVDSIDEVNRIADTAVAAGGSENRPAQDHGFMFQRSFNDPDGHIWEVFWMDMSKIDSGG